MKSDVIHVTNEAVGIREALNQAESVAAYKGLSPKDALHLRLLSEEMMGMLRALTQECEADFWIEDEGGVFQLHLLTSADMTTEMRRKLLSSSTRGKNVSARGVMGKIRDIFERAIEPYSTDMDHFFSAGLVYAGEDPVNSFYGGTATWSFNQYRESVGTDPESEEWDELEKSIIANLADEIQIGIRSTKVEMIIFKKF